MTQNLAHRVNDNHGFEVPSIFLPRDDTSPEMAKFNNIGKLCREIDTTIKQKVQVNLDTLRDDAASLLGKVNSEIQSETKMASDSRSKNLKAFGFGCVAWVFMPLLGVRSTSIGS